MAQTEFLGVFRASLCVVEFVLIVLWEPYWITMANISNVASHGSQIVVRYPLETGFKTTG